MKWKEDDYLFSGQLTILPNSERTDAAPVKKSSLLMDEGFLSLLSALIDAASAELNNGAYMHN